MPKAVTVAADPYPWPFDGDFGPHNTALVVIDMQTDFCAPGGYVDSMGYDISLTRAPIEPIQSVLAAMRAKGYPIIHTREGHKPDLSRPAGQQALALAADRRRHRRPGAVRPHPGARRAGLGDHPGAAAASRARRSSTSRARAPSSPPISNWCCRRKRIRNIVLTGVTTDVCVHTTMRDANDRGYECLLLEDCCAATKVENHLAAIDMIKMQGGVFGAVATSPHFLEALP